MSVTRFYDEHNTETWWAWTKVRAFRVTFKGGYYTARCGQFKGRGTTIRAAVAKAAMQCARPRCCEPVPF